jgi:tetratricopeptide (TPR) repeat protein
MGRLRVLLLAGAGLIPSAPAVAADQLKFGPAPAWVTPRTIPDSQPTKAPVALLLQDQQTSLDGGKIKNFNETAFRIQTPEGLAAANIAIVWQPASDTVTVHKLQIRRGGKIIDVLANGQTFTILRRETNLEAATLDGTLTGTLQPEGLQVGDVIDFATTVERSDPVLKGHVETMFGAWDGVPIQSAHAALSWPKNLHLQIRETPSLPAARRSDGDGESRIEISAQDVQPLIAPKNAPDRFKITRLGEATDFTSWSDVANLFIPLFRDASAIPASGPLHDEVERIRTASSDPKARAQKALSLVQDRVRYVALLMGQGGYVPASAETTWSRRFGDCKAKTALLLGILHSLGIEAEPVLVQSRAGDVIADRLPMVSLFNHVLVRAHIGGKDYWLDGTRTGDNDLDSLEVPDFKWGLPVVAQAKLVPMVPAPLKLPNLERRVTIDASGGVFGPTPVTLNEIYRGDTAVALNVLYSALTADQRDEQLRSEAKSFFDDISVESSSVQFVKDKRELDVTIKGAAKLNWRDNWLYIPTSSIAFDPDFDRPAGPLHDVPLAVGYPSYVKDQATITLPPGFAAQQKLSAPVHETLAGVEYSRVESIEGDVLTVNSSERSLAPEIPYKEALAAASRIRSLSNNDVYISSAVAYAPTARDVAALAAKSPASADEFVDRGNLYLDGGKYDEAIADFTNAIKLDAKQKWALANRGLAYVWKQRFDDAAKDLNAALAQDSGNAVALRAMALMSQFKGDCAKAVDLYTQSLAREPGNSFSLGHRAECEAFLSKDDQALADIAKALDGNPRWIDLRLSKANILLRMGKRDLVEAEADTLTRESPQSNYAWVGAAKIYSAIGLRTKAMQAMDRALAIKPEAYVYVNRAQVRPASDIGGQLADLDAALKLEPAMPEALSIKASILAKQHKYTDALALYDRISKSAADQQWIGVQRAVLLYKAGRISDARQEFALVRSQAKSANEMNSLCWAEGTAGIMLDDAVEECRDAVKQSGGAPQYVDSLGMALLQSGKLDEALAAYDQAIAKAPISASYMGRAIIYARKGDSSRAKVELQAAKKLDAEIEQRFADYGLKL